MRSIHPRVDESYDCFSNWWEEIIITPTHVGVAFSNVNNLRIFSSETVWEIGLNKWISKSTRTVNTFRPRRRKWIRYFENKFKDNFEFAFTKNFSDPISYFIIIKNKLWLQYGVRLMVSEAFNEIVRILKRTTRIKFKHLYLICETIDDGFHYLWGLILSL